MGWKPYHSQQCETRYIMVSVMHKSGATLTDSSEIVLDIQVTELKDHSNYLKLGLSAVGLLAISLI